MASCSGTPETGPMLSLDQLLEILGYSASAFFRESGAEVEPEAVQLFRQAIGDGPAAEGFGIRGFYFLQTAPDHELPMRPAVCVAEASTPEAARELHRRIWNIGTVPFLVIRLPDEIRVYAGFRYNPEHEKDGLVLREDEPDREGLKAKLSDYSRDSIDSARIWQAQRQHLETKYRVDAKLLENLKHLGQALATRYTPRLEPTVAHALIGKYVYLRYLRDRGILDDGWLASRRIRLADIFGPNATVSALVALVDALEARFNGDIFHIDFGSKCSVTDDHVRLVASVLEGAAPRVHPEGFLRQLHLDFQAFDFRHIPVEMLSSIYEQFLHAERKGRAEGAYYTPEVLADYLLAEINAVRAIRPGITILDPACGSGIFLVLAYRRLIELEQAAGGHYGSLDPMRLREILLGSIFGVERQRDACNVTAFSLILTLLNYVDPPALHANKDFKFPDLLNKDRRIVCDDFFKPDLPLPIPPEGFDVVVGNPPWIELKPSTKREHHARKWITGEKNIAGNRVADAFAVKAGRLLSKDGVAGFLLPASTLFTLEGKRFRQKFFAEFAVARVTNFANLRGNLFGGRVIQPTATLVFRRADDVRLESPIAHHAPFAVNQVAGGAEELWVLTVHGSETQLVPQSEAATGETLVWKLALWGTRRDARALDRIRRLYPLTLEAFCGQRGWGQRMPREGVQLRPRDSEEELIPCEELKGEKRFNAGEFNKRVKGGMHFSLPPQALTDIPEAECYARKRGGLGGLAVNRPPHLLIPDAWKNFLIYSDQYFAIPPRKMGITCPEEDADALRALTVFLGSSLVDYYLFFHVPQWGVYSTMPIVVQRAVRAIPTPCFTQEQITLLAQAHRQILRGEKQFRLVPDDVSADTEKQRLIDQTVFDVLQLPDDLRLLVHDFRDHRLPMDRGGAAPGELARKATINCLRAYARTLRDELERFLLDEAHVAVRVLRSPDIVQCEVRLQAAIPKSKGITILDADSDARASRHMRDIRRRLSEHFSQWTYVDRSLRVYEEDTIQIFNAPRLMDWTRTQALNDADRIIAEILLDGEPTE